MELRLTTVVIALCFAGLVAGNAITRSFTSTNHDVTRLLRDLCDRARDEVQPEAAGLFKQLVHAVRGLDEQEAQQIHRQVTSGQLCASEKLKDIWSDALLMDMSPAAAQIVAQQVSQLTNAIT